MEFLLLGPLEAAEGKRTVRLGPPRQRAVLAMLALGAPDVVSTDRLVDGLWGDEPTSNPLGTLQVYVHGVRKALRQVSEVELVERVSPGYRLAITSEQTDIGRFTSLQQRARDERLRGKRLRPPRRWRRRSACGADPPWPTYEVRPSPSRRRSGSKSCA